MTDRLKALADAGVSIWLDDLSRERIETGNLAELVRDRSVVGVTTNPTIFAGAIANGERYDAQVRQLAEGGMGVDEVIFALTTDDVRNACDVLAATAAATNGVDGRVSIEVAPDLARDTDATIAQAQDLWKIVDRPNALIKIPATAEGLPAITAVISRKIVFTSTSRCSLLTPWANARICRTKPEPRSALFSSRSTIRSPAGSETHSRSIGAAINIGASTLFRSCAIPEASRPMFSMRCARRNCSSRRFRSVMSRCEPHTRCRQPSTTTPVRLFEKWTQEPSALRSRDSTSVAR